MAKKVRHLIVEYDWSRRVLQLKHSYLHVDVNIQIDSQFHRRQNDVTHTPSVYLACTVACLTFACLLDGSWPSRRATCQLRNYVSMGSFHTDSGAEHIDEPQATNVVRTQYIPRGPTSAETPRNPPRECG